MAIVMIESFKKFSAAPTPEQQAFIKDTFGVEFNERTLHEYTTLHEILCCEANGFSSNAMIAARIKKTKFRLDLLQTYEESFFETRGAYRRPLLVMAVLADDLLDRKPFPFDSSWEKPTRDLRIEIKQLVTSGELYFDAATPIQDTPEAVFAAHVAFLDFLEPFTKRISTSPDDTLDDLTYTDLQGLFLLWDPNSPIGQRLNAEAVDLEHRMARQQRDPRKDNIISLSSVPRRKLN